MALRRNARHRCAHAHRSELSHAHVTQPRRGVIAMNLHRRSFVSASIALAAGAAIAPFARANGRTLFVRSAFENADGTATLPLYRGTSNGRSVWFIVLDTSSGSEADRLGVNRSSKLANAANTTAVQRVRVVNGVI